MAGHRQGRPSPDVRNDCPVRELQGGAEEACFLDRLAGDEPLPLLRPASDPAALASGPGR